MTKQNENWVKYSIRMKSFLCNNCQTSQIASRLNHSKQSDYFNKTYYCVVIHSENYTACLAETENSKKIKWYFHKFSWTYLMFKCLYCLDLDVLLWLWLWLWWHVSSCCNWEKQMFFFCVAYYKKEKKFFHIRYPVTLNEDDSIVYIHSNGTSRLHMFVNMMYLFIHQIILSEPNFQASEEIDSSFSYRILQHKENSRGRNRLIGE